MANGKERRKPTRFIVVVALFFARLFFCFISKWRHSSTILQSQKWRQKGTFFTTNVVVVVFLNEASTRQAEGHRRVQRLLIPPFFFSPSDFFNFLCWLSDFCRFFKFKSLLSRLILKFKQLLYFSWLLSTPTQLSFKIWKCNNHYGHIIKRLTIKTVF